MCLGLGEERECERVLLQWGEDAALSCVGVLFFFSRSKQVYFCTGCRKKFKTREMLTQHMGSKKHKTVAAGRSDEELTQIKEAETREREEDEGDAEVKAEKKVEKGRRLGFLECSFCGEKSADAEENAAHMGLHHGFFVPDVEYLTNLEGLLSYIG